MTLLDLLQTMDGTVSRLQTARVLAGVAFLSLLLALGAGLRKTRRLLSVQEAEAALEADFERLERSSSGREG